MSSAQGFAELGLPQPILNTLAQIGFETPTPIQAEAIPVVLSGQDVLGQAQTGTGKTAAFGLPLLANTNDKADKPQAIILAPTRELVAQIATALESFSQYNPKLRITTLYGGQSYGEQLRALKKGAHIIVGAPGRVMDHIKRKTLDLSDIQTIVLDEADEMLRMGFVEDVEWICSHAPKEAQKLLFSATMPKEIQRIAKNYLNEPHKIHIKGKTSLDNIGQRYWFVKGLHKLDALSRLLETEETDGVIIFVRTKDATLDIANRLQERGFLAAALNGDMTQDAREAVVKQLKNGKINIVVATDVAARGLDVERINHVFNYDIPFNTEAYVHRIGRTGRAGRQGQAILFVSPRERRLLRNIEHATKQKITELTLPSPEKIAKIRVERFKAKLTASLQSNDLSFYQKIAAEYMEEHSVEPTQMMAALMKQAEGSSPLRLEKNVHQPSSSRRDFERSKPQGQGRNKRGAAIARLKAFRVEVGKNHGVKPGNILGAIANEADLSREFIGSIKIYKNFSTVELPGDLCPRSLKTIANARVAGQPLKISEWSSRS